MRTLSAKTVVILFIFSIAMAPRAGSPSAEKLARTEFQGLLESLAGAWSRQDTDAALACFTDDALYMQPPDQQLYRGTSELRLLFDGLKPGTVMKFHHFAFDPDSQDGFAEFSFGRSGSETAVHGVVRIALSERRISLWREYFESGPASFEDFIKIEGKTWKWTAESLE